MAADPQPRPTGPEYREIADDLRRRIESGELARGSQLPTEIELMELHSASRNTVRDAIKLLITRGMVETRAGQGTFVAEKIVPFVTTLTGDPETARGGGESAIYLAEVAAEGRKASFTEPRVEIQRAEGAVARALRVPAGTQLVSRHRERSIDGIPWSLETSFYPMSLVERGAVKLIQATDIEEGTVEYLGRDFGVVQVGYRDTIAVRAPNEHETAYFRLPPDGRVPVFDIHRVAFDEDGTRIRLTVSVYPADRNRFRINVGRVPARGESAPA